MVHLNLVCLFKEHFGDFRITLETPAIHTMLLLRISMNQYADVVVERVLERESQ